MSGLLIRPYRVTDPEALARLFHDAVQNGAAEHYSQRERDAWSPAPPEGSAWAARLSKAQTMVAEDQRVPVGFMTLNTETGFLDYAYVRPDRMGQGVAATLYAVLEGRARVMGLDRIETEASHLAERFFLRRGWRLLERQSVVRNGVEIPNARMDKPLEALARIAA